MVLKLVTKTTKTMADARLSRQLVPHFVAYRSTILHLNSFCLAINWLENHQLIGRPWSNGGVTIIMTC